MEIQKWQYHLMVGWQPKGFAPTENDPDPIEEYDLEKILNRGGMHGWELVSTETIIKDGTTIGMMYFLKRPYDQETIDKEKAEAEEDGKRPRKLKETSEDW